MVNSMLVKAILFNYRNLMLASFKLQTLAVFGNPGSSTFGHFKLYADFLSVALEVGLDETIAGVDCDLSRSEVAHLRTDLEFLEARFRRCDAGHVLRKQSQRTATPSVVH